MSTAPGADSVTVKGKLYRSFQEGSATILAPYRETAPNAKKARNNNEGDQAVFYNPIQQFNRDLSVLAILIYGEDAILRKEERFKKKTASKKARQKKQESKSSSDHTQPAEFVESTTMPNPKKRKVEDDSVNGGVQDKRQRVDECDMDEDELAVVQLSAPEPEGADEDELAVVQLSSLVPQGADVVVKGSGKLGSNGDVPRTDSKSTKNQANKRHGTSFTILDALSATGLRALRYAKEIPFATKIIANDISPDAVESIELNMDHNDVGGIVYSNVGDARAYMYSKVGNERLPSNNYVHRFDVIDLDPYGTAAPFFDAAVQSLQDGGLLCVTCTDAGVFASMGYLEKTYDLYGGLPLKGAHSHEGGLRLILHAIATSAAKYGIAIEPLLSLSIDFYARLFIRVHKQQKDVKLLAGTTMIVYSCDFGCGSWTTQLLARNQPGTDKVGNSLFNYKYAQAPSVGPLCEQCGSKMHLGGPMWAGPLHNPHFIQRILDRLPTLDRKVYGTVDRLQGMLTVALEEDLTLAASNLEADTTNTVDTSSNSKLIPRLPPETIDPSPFFIIPNFLAKTLHCQTPSEDQLRGAIRHLGYRVTRSHCKSGSLRTNAPWSVLWEIFREFIRTKSPIRDGAVTPGTPGWAILAKARGTERKAVTDLKDDLTSQLRKAASLTDVKTILEAAMYRFGSTDLAKEDATIEGNGTHTHGDFGVEKLDPSKLEIVFDEQLGKEKPRGKLVRYQVNPRANWGPMNRAGASGG
jgi:tRNA (guanine26-N2/guanine27-N2)-dimethyltransferase